MIVLALLLALSGFLCLAMVTERHWRDFASTPPTPGQVRVLTVIGYALLLGALWACVRQWGWAMGSIGVWGVLAVSAGLVLLWLSFRARQRR